MKDIHKLLDTYLWWESRSKDSVYLDKKESLIDRDPLTQDLLKELIRYKPKKTEIILPSLSLLGSSPEVSYTYKRPARLNELIQQLEDKWGVHIGITSESDHTHNPNHIDKLREHCRKVGKPFPYDRPFNIYHSSNAQRKEPITEITTGDEGKLTLQFDLSLLDNSTNTKGFILKTVWDVVRKRLDERDKIFKDKIFSKREGDLTRALKWYDLHMGGDLQTPKGFNFRQIARINLFEQIKKYCPDKMNKFIKVMGKIENLNKKAQESLEPYIKEKIVWEDAIEKAVKDIWKAIHRESYPSKGRFKLFNCATHGDLCPEDCKHLQNSMSVFDNRMKLKRIYTTDNENDFNPKLAKGKAATIRGIRKKMDY